MRPEPAAPSARRAVAAYRDQSAHDLRLELLGGDLDLAQFRVLDRARLELDWVALDARIIGASHLIRIDLPGADRVHEILACGPVIGGVRTLYSGGVRALPGRLDLPLAEGVAYCFASELCSAVAGAPRLGALERRIESARGAARGGRQLGLRFDFPPAPRAGASRESPRTLAWLGIDPDGEAIEVETAHSYPNEGSVVFSRTRLSRGVACA